MSGDQPSSAVKAALKSRGFRVKGATFYRAADGGNTVLICVQRSVTSSPTESKLTVNVGVYSARVGRSLGDAPSASSDIWQAHWRTRIVEGGREKWLHVQATDSPDTVAAMLLTEIEPKLHDAFNHATDEALRDLWLSGASPGATKTQRPLFLAIILNAIGPSETTSSIVTELRALVRGTAQESAIESQLATAGVPLR